MEKKAQSVAYVVLERIVMIVDQGWFLNDQIG